MLTKCQQCNSFVLVPKANGKVRLCLDLSQLNKVLIVPILQVQSLNEILARQTGVKYLSLVHASSGYYNLKLDEKSSYLMTFSCPFGVALAGDMFQKKIDELFNDIPNVFGINDDIVIAGFNASGTDHDARCKQLF